MPHERDVLKNFLKFTDKLKKKSSGGVLSKDVLKIFTKFTEKHLYRNLFFNLQTGNPKLSETATEDVQYNKVFLKISQISEESLFNKVAVLRACSFIKKSLRHRCFPVKFAKFLRTTILKNIWLLLNSFKNRLQHRCFPGNFVNYSRISTLKSTYERLVLKHRYGAFSLSCQPDSMESFNSIRKRL